MVQGLVAQRLRDPIRQRFKASGLLPGECVMSRVFCASKMAEYGTDFDVLVRAEYCDQIVEIVGLEAEAMHTGVELKMNSAGCTGSEVADQRPENGQTVDLGFEDRKSTRLNSSHVKISY